MPRKKPENYISRIRYTKEQIEEFNKNNPGKEIDKYGNIYKDAYSIKFRKARKCDISKLIGEIFGRLKVVKFMYKDNNSTKIYLKCECLCKNIVYAQPYELISGRISSCGCAQKEKASISHYENLVGKIFGELTVLEECEERANGQLRLWKCRCSCGKITYATTGSLKIGNKKSCGHLRLENAAKATTTHGMCKDRIYKIWTGVKQRCNCPTDSEYQFYGGRGIKIYNKWNDDFMSFYNWAITNGYSNDLTLDRINVNGHYIPNNCRWVDHHTQCCNTRRNVTTIDCYVPADLLRLTNIPNRKGIRKLYPDINKITIRDFCDRIFGEGNNYNLLSQVVRHHTSEFISEMTNHLIDIYKEIHDICYPKDGTKRKISSGICQERLMNRRAFIDWAIDNGYYKDYKIGLIDPNKDYSPDNCFIDYSKNT